MLITEIYSNLSKKGNVELIKNVVISKGQFITFDSSKYKEIHVVFGVFITSDQTKYEYRSRITIPTSICDSNGGAETLIVRDAEQVLGSIVFSLGNNNIYIHNFSTENGITAKGMSIFGIY